MSNGPCAKAAVPKSEIQSPDKRQQKGVDYWEKNPTVIPCSLCLPGNLVEKALGSCHTLNIPGKGLEGELKRGGWMFEQQTGPSLQSLDGVLGAFRWAAVVGLGLDRLLVCFSNLPGVTK